MNLDELLKNEEVRQAALHVEIIRITEGMEA